MRLNSNWGIFKSAVSFILAFSIGIGMGGPKVFAISEEEKVDIIKQAEQYLKDNGVRFSKENNSVEKIANEPTKQLDCNAKKGNKDDLVDPAEVDKFLEENQKYFPDEEIFKLRKELLMLTKKEFLRIKSLSFRGPGIMCLISLLLGLWGVDRFLLKDIPLGVLKLMNWISVSGGSKLEIVHFAFFIFYLVDIFLTRGNTKEYNLKMILEAISKA